jgi:hypothetical protein
MWWRIRKDEVKSAAECARLGWTLRGGENAAERLQGGMDGDGGIVRSGRSLPGST